MLTKVCRHCRIEKPLDRDHFGSANAGLAWQSHCKECGKARSKKHREEKGSILATYDKERRNRDARPLFSDSDKLSYWRKQNGICLCCAKPIEENKLTAAQIDHKTPLVRGGGHESSNLALAHRECNLAKHNKILVQHWNWRFRAGLDDYKITEYILNQKIEAARYREA